MGRRTATTIHLELEAFLADNVGKAQSGDVGALLGQAALLGDSALAGERVPAAWHEALNAALAGEPRSRRTSAGTRSTRRAAH